MFKFVLLSSILSLHTSLFSDYGLFISISKRFLWRRFENGILGHLQQELNNPLQLQVADKVYCPFSTLTWQPNIGIRNAKMSSFEKWFTTSASQRWITDGKCLQTSRPSQVSHRLYGRRYMLVYMVAIANLVAQVSPTKEVPNYPPLQFFFTDHFLNYEFLRYIHPSPASHHFPLQLCAESLERGSDTSRQGFSQAGEMFPLQVFLSSATVHWLVKYISRYGGSGTLQNYDAICLLPLNILNEKL